MKLLLLGGLGDVFVGTSFLDFHKVAEAYWATKVHAALVPLFEIVYPNMQHFVISEVFKASNKSYIFAEHLPVRPYPEDCVEWSPGTLAAANPDDYHPSPLLSTKVADVAKFNLPNDYVFIQPTSLNCTNNDRDFNELDWTNTLHVLGDRKGVVVDASYMDVPDDDRLINLQRQTTLGEAVEILKGASGYLGIDSCFSILAVQIGYPLQIKSTNTWYYGCAKSYCAPHRTFPFVNWGITKKKLA